MRRLLVRFCLQADTAVEIALAKIGFRVALSLCVFPFGATTTLSKQLHNYSSEQASSSNCYVHV